jgi:hypothetical protein
MNEIPQDENDEEESKAKRKMEMVSTSQVFNYPNVPHLSSSMLFSYPYNIPIAI